MTKKNLASIAIACALAAGCGVQETQNYTGSGTIEAVETTISAETRGRLVEYDIDEGDSVSAGQVIARIDVEVLRLQREAAATALDELAWNERVLTKEIAAAGEGITQARAANANAEKTLDRITALVAQKAATQEQLDRADTERTLAVSALDAAVIRRDTAKTRLGSLDATRASIQANLALLDRQIADGEVTSPVDGVVVASFAEPGEVVAFGTPLCTVADLASVRLAVYVGETDIGRTRLGAAASVHVDSHPDRSFPGTVSWISPRAEFTPKNVQTRDARADLVYEVRLTVVNPDGIFKIGMPADATIEGL